MAPCKHHVRFPDLCPADHSGRSAAAAYIEDAEEDAMMIDHSQDLRAAMVSGLHITITADDGSESDFSDIDQDEHTTRMTSVASPPRSYGGYASARRMRGDRHNDVRGKGVGSYARKSAHTRPALETHGWTFGYSEYDRSAIKVKLGDVQNVIDELDTYKMTEMDVHADSINNTLTYGDSAERRELYTTSKFVFLAMQKEILRKYNNITVDKVLEICRLDPIDGTLSVV